MQSISDKNFVDQHTPGPWYYEADDPERSRDYYVSTNLPGASSFGCSIIAKVRPVSSENHHEANARLIAAAPDLLAACIAALPSLSAHEQTGCDCPDSEAARLLRQAILDAQGGAA